MTSDDVQEGLIIIRDAKASRWLTFRHPQAIVTADRPDEVIPTLNRVQQAVDSGLYAAGYVAYEAAPGFDAALTTHPGSSPLIWFGIYESVEASSELALRQPVTPEVRWQPNVSRTTYATNVKRIREEIASGNTYQVNYSLRFRTRYEADPLDAFMTLASCHAAPYAAYIDSGDRIIASHSPELFFRLDGQQILCRPMKGTAPRGLTAEDDEQRRQALAASDKDRAENLMIVDMIRNDLGRIAIPGSIRVPDIFTLETYDSVHQMTTSVLAKTHATVADVLAALFPSASITGAPRVNTMRLIRDLEPDPRGIYTGSIGYLAPDRTAQFNVAIRTLEISRTDQHAIYGAGGGIVWDSRADSEYAECLTKTRVVSETHEPFELLETLRWTPEEGYALYRYHLQRLQMSANYFGFRLDSSVIEQNLAARAGSFDPFPHRVRLTLTRTGTVAIDAVPLAADQPGSGPRAVAVAEDHPIHSNNRFVYHKTTNRTVYGERLAHFPDCDDIILCNELGELTESCIANLVVVIDGQHFTPPVSCGLLAGTFRQAMLDQGQIQERVLRPADLLICDEVYLINSVRGRMEIQLRPPGEAALG